MMKPEIIDQLLREEEDLQKKLDAVRGMLSAYGHKMPVKSSEAAHASGSDKTQKVRERCVPLIKAQNGTPIKTRDILKVLLNEGYQIGGKNEVATLSAMLSNSGQFEAIGRSGWVLKTKSDDQKDESPALTGPSENNGGGIVPKPGYQSEPWRVQVPSPPPYIQPTKRQEG